MAMLSLGCLAAAASAALGNCTIFKGLDVRAPHHFDEVNTSTYADCCTACGNNSRCVFWSFKASDVPGGTACRRFDSMPQKNTTSSAFVAGSAPPPGPPPPPSQVRLTVNGSDLIDPSGEKLRLTGFNWPIIHVHDGDGALMAKKLPGANVARIVGVLWDNSDAKSDCYTDTPPFFKESCFGKLDAAVKAATEAKVWVILAARCKYAAGSDYETDPNANVFHNSTLRNMLYVAWDHVAKHYASWDYIAAYEPMAEPRDKLASATVIREFYDGACKAVQGADPNTLCMVGPGPYYKLWHFNEDILLPDNPNVIYTFDYFVPDGFVFGETSIPQYPGTYNCSTLYTDVWTDICCPDGAGSNMTFDATWNEANFKKFALPLRAHGLGVPVFVNQWSVVHGVPESAGRYQYMSDVAKQLQAAGIGWAWWVWRGGGDGWSHGSSEFVYQWSNGTIEYDEQAFAAVAPYV